MKYSAAQIRERADRARQLLADDMFAEMLTEIRMNALNELAELEVTDTNGILRQQAIVAVTGQIKDLLEAAITATGEKDGGFSMTESSQEE